MVYELARKNGSENHQDFFTEHSIHQVLNRYTCLKKTFFRITKLKPATELKELTTSGLYMARLK
jgi:hypothetical protein